MYDNGPIPFAVALGAEHLPVTTPVQHIVAAQVPGKVSFDGVEVTNVQPLQLYTRSADRIEAATRIATGQHLDIQA
jgi:hypothetical protein